MSRPLRLYGRTALLGEPGESILGALIEVDPQSGSITSIQAGVSEADAEADYGADVIMPGLVDTHVHLNLPGDGTEFETALAVDDATLRELVAERLETLLAHGVTTVRDVGSRGRTVLDVRNAATDAGSVGPRLLASGPPLTVPKGHCWWMGGEIEDDAEVARARVRHLVAEGVDFIKVMGSGGGTPGSRSWEAAFSTATLAAIVDEAALHGRTVTAHCLCAEATRRAVDAGVHNIEHAAFSTGPSTNEYDESVVEALAAAGTPVAATLAVSATAIRTLESRGATTAAAAEELASRIVFRQARREQTRRSARKGVRFVAGSDAGWRYTSFPAVVDEVEELVASGLDIHDALAGATAWAADAIGLGAVTGRLRVGLAADVLGFDTDPRADLAHLREPRWIIAVGRSVATATRSLQAELGR